MSVRKRKWTTRNGEQREAWIVDYWDQHGERHIKTFDRKKDADTYRSAVDVDVQKGIHTPENRSITVQKAADHWIDYVELEGRERSTIEQYRQHVRQHIVPRLGREKLAKLTTPRINAFRDELLRSLSRPMARKVLASLKAILKDANRRGNVAQNVASAVSIGTDRRGKRKLEVGRDIPTPEEMGRILRASEGRWRPLLIVAAFAGLRSSELRGLRWCDVDLKGKKIHVRQRADRWNTIGNPKSEAGDRTISIRDVVVNALREWRLKYPRPIVGRDDDGNPIRENAKSHHLVFPNGNGHVENHGNIVQRGFWPAQIAAGVTVPVMRDGKPVLDKGEPVAKYTGLHTTRHFFASWCINRKADGGRELPLKTVQSLLGHSSIVMTGDTYGHLFPSDGDTGEPTAVELALG